MSRRGRVLAVLVVAAFAGVPSAAGAASVLTGRVSASGAVVAGSGFTVSHPSTGRYVISYDDPFVETPVVVVTAYGETGVEPLATGSITDGSSDESGVEVVLVQHATNFPLADAAFDFIVRAIDSGDSEPGGGGGTGASGGVVSLDQAAIERLDLTWWGVWFLGGIATVGLIAPTMVGVWRWWRP